MPCRPSRRRRSCLSLREKQGIIASMAAIVNDPWLEQRLRAERQAWGADRYDEVWEGVYVMAPVPNTEHQQIVSRLVAILEEVVGWPGLGEVFAGVNLTDRDSNWEQDYRVPDVVVFLRGGSARDFSTHWRGAADLVVEITSPGDRTREKLPFYSRLGVTELLLLDRESWTLGLYRRMAGRLECVGQSTAVTGEVLSCASVPLSLQLVPGTPRPRIAVTDTASGRSWTV